MQILKSDGELLKQFHERWVRGFKNGTVQIAPDAANGSCLFRFVSGVQHMELTFAALCEHNAWTMVSEDFAQYLDALLEEHDVRYDGTSITDVTGEMVWPVENRPAPFVGSFSEDCRIDSEDLDDMLSALYQFMDAGSTNTSRNTIMIARTDKKISWYSTDSNIMCVFSMAAHKAMTEEDPFCMSLANAKFLQYVAKNMHGSMLTDDSRLSIQFDRTSSYMKVTGPGWSCVFANAGRSAIRPSSVRFPSAPSFQFYASIWRNNIDDFVKMAHAAGMKETQITIDPQKNDMCSVSAQIGELSYDERYVISDITDRITAVRLNTRYLKNALDALRGNATMYISPDGRLVRMHNVSHKAETSVYIATIKEEKQ